MAGDDAEPTDDFGIDLRWPGGDDEPEPVPGAAGAVGAPDAGSEVTPPSLGPDPQVDPPAQPARGATGRESSWASEPADWPVPNRASDGAEGEAVEPAMSGESEALTSPPETAPSPAPAGTPQRSTASPQPGGPSPQSRAEFAPRRSWEPLLAGDPVTKPEPPTRASESRTSPGELDRPTEPRHRAPAATRSRPDGSAAAGTAPAGGGDSPGVPGLSTVIGRIDGIQGAVATLCMRVDALTSATNTFRSSISDRVADYSETVARLARTHDTELDEYRHASDRSLGELRRSITEGEEVMRRTSARVDEVSSDVQALAEQVRTASADTRDVVAATEKLARLVTDGLDSFGDRLLERLDEQAAAAAEQTSAVRTELARVHRGLGEMRKLRAGIAELKNLPVELAAGTGGDPDLLDAIVELRAQVRDLGPGPAVNLELVDTVAALSADVRELAAGQGTDLELLDAVNALGAEVRELVRAPQAPAVDDSVMTPVLEELTQIRRRLGVRAKTRVELHEDQLEAIVSAVVSRLEAAFELVVEKPPTDPVPEPAPERPSRRRR
ncbi:hypothetical protein BH18ACT4_BH18ACT4_01470 [soil metagenome]